MSEEPAKTPLAIYAKNLTIMAVMALWAILIIIGYNVIEGNTSAAVVWLLILGFCLPVCVSAIIGLIQERYSGKETDPREIVIAFMYGLFFLVAFGACTTLIPMLIKDFRS